MSRIVPHDNRAICDECGAEGAYDFMGDMLCVICADIFVDADDEEDDDDYAVY